MLGSALIILGIVWFFNSGESIQDFYTANKPKKKATIISTQRDPNKPPVFLGKQEIKDIHVESIKTKKDIFLTKTDELKTFINSMDTAKKGKLTLDEEGSDLIDCDMWITFEDGTYKKYFIWVVDHHSNEVMIAQQDTPDDVNLTYYQLNEDSSKKVYNLFKKII
ncbi:hypothetical protein JDS99_02300 [Bacillus cereus group sp. N6]|uniref:hypothetical protein n=1 Tax=Bacillus cereus group sp. N6 TaxID=2794583 RepID=UPI0018F6FF92|nr:hypothetical protein [Bacillus cereus group sp. N6]MBJ8108495.1 hypothetical protein [Bacillus cereus group sp. N6]